jgi:hypothetical protein
VAVLNPLGLAIFGAAFSQSVTDWFRGLWLTVALGIVAVLLPIGLLEWRIRSRRLRAREQRCG